MKNKKKKKRKNVIKKLSVYCPLDLFSFFPIGGVDCVNYY